MVTLFLFKLIKKKNRTMFNFIRSIIKKRAIREASIVYVGACINGLSLFLINVILARSLEQTKFAIFSLTIMVLATIAEMSDFGLNGGLARFAPYYIRNHEENKLKQLLKIIWQWRIWMSFGLTIGGIVVADFLADTLFHQPILSSYLRFSFLGIGGVILLGFTSTYLKAQEWFMFDTKVQSFKGLLRVFGIGILVLFGIENLFWFLGIYIMIPWILFFISYRKLPQGFRRASLNIDDKKALTNKLTQFSFWLTIWSLSAIVAGRIDQIMLSSMLSLKEVAIYTTAFQFIFIYLLGLQSVNAILTPKLSSIPNKREVVVYIKRLLKYLFPVWVLLCVAIYASQFMVTMIFGNTYSESVPVYVWLSMSMSFNFLGLPFSFIPQLFNKTQIVALSGVIQLVLNIVLNLYLIPRYGVMGAAYTFTIGVIVSILFNFGVSLYLLKNKEITMA